MGINVLSLFDGKSCGQLALERAGIQVNNYYASEIAEGPMKIANYNHPNTIHLGDIQKIKLQTIKELPKIDLVLAGSPCQGFSRQGKGLNFDDPRSRLFFDFVEVLSFVKYFNPNVKFLLENVDMKREWEDIITDYMQVQPIKINSRLVAAANRPRTYWTDIENVTIPENRGILLKSILDQNVEGDYLEHQGIKICSSFSENSRNLVNVIDGEVRVSQSTKLGYIVANDGDGINISFPKSKSRRARVVDQKSSTLDTSCNIGVFHNGVIRRFTLNELEKLQTLPVDYTNVPGVSETDRKKAIGNGWTIDAIAHILKGFSCG